MLVFHCLTFYTALEKIRLRLLYFVFLNSTFIHLIEVLNVLCQLKNYNINRFKFIITCSNVFDLIKLEAICILTKKPDLCKQKDFDYTVSLFP